MLDIYPFAVSFFGLKWNIVVFTDLTLTRLRTVCGCALNFFCLICDWRVWQVFVTYSLTNPPVFKSCNKVRLKSVLNLVMRTVTWWGYRAYFNVLLHQEASLHLYNAVLLRPRPRQQVGYCLLVIFIGGQCNLVYIIGIYLLFCNLYCTVLYCIVLYCTVQCQGRLLIPHSVRHCGEILCRHTTSATWQKTNLGEW